MRGTTKPEQQSILNWRMKRQPPAVFRWAFPGSMIGGPHPFVCLITSISSTMDFSVRRFHFSFCGRKNNSHQSLENGGNNRVYSEASICSVFSHAESSLKCSLLRSEKYSDITIRCQGTTFKLHCAIVCTRSPVLAKRVDGMSKVWEFQTHESACS